MKKEISVKNNQGVFVLLLLFVSTISCTPLLSNSRYLVLTGIAASILIIMNVEFIASPDRKFIARAVLLYLFFVFGYKLIGYSSAAWGNYMNQTVFFICILLMLLIPPKLSEKRKKQAWFLMAFMIVFNICDNIRLSILYPQINTLRLYQDDEFLQSINAGGTTFYTFSMFFFMACFFVFLNGINKKVKYTSLVFAVLTSVYICWFCMKASVVVYYFLSIIFLIYGKHTKNISTFYTVLLFTALLLYIFVGFFSDAIVDLVISISPDERITTRLVTLIDSDSVEANMGTVTGRTKLYMLSVYTWLDNIGNFLFGIGDHRAMFGASKTGIGQHSDLLDSLARYGLIGLVLLALILKKTAEYLQSLFAPQYRLQIAVFFIVFVLCGFTKGIFYPRIGCALFLFFPLCSVLVDNKK